jgi:hypothetical protein
LISDRVAGGAVFSPDVCDIEAVEAAAIAIATIVEILVKVFMSFDPFIKLSSEANAERFSKANQCVGARSLRL